MFACDCPPSDVAKERMASVPRVAGFDRPSFIANFLRPNLPVVYEGYACRWQAVQKWSPDFLLKTHGATELPVPGRHPVRLSDYIRSLKRADTARALPYLRNIWLARHFPDLVSDVLVPEMAEPNWLTHRLLRAFIPRDWVPWFEFFLSASRTRFPFVHQDTCSTHAWLLQVYGEKKVWLWPPDAASPSQGATTIPVSPEQDLARFFPDHLPTTAVLQPGDILLIPANWWHTAESLTISITLSGNFVNDTNWHAFFASYFLREEKSALAKDARMQLARIRDKVVADCTSES
jgi:histone arginine demethylase JMJD6